jgi:hypothetical protein
LKPKTLYQTLEDRENHLDVEKDGPFACRWTNTWLGDGYYFWDTFFDLAEWWGEIRYPNKYMICEAKCDFVGHKVLDLVGEMEDIILFRDALSKMKGRGLINKNTTVSRVIRFMKEQMKCFDYDAMRVHGLNSISSNGTPNKKFIKRLKFETDKGQVLDLLPAVQVCIYTKTGLGLRNYSVVYPDHYREDYVV